MPQIRAYSAKNIAVNRHTPLQQLDWIGPQRARQLARAGLETLEDLLTHYPRRHEDRRQFDRFPTAERETPVCVCGVVRAVSAKRIRGRQKMFEATLEEEQAHALSGRLVCRWFNAFWVEKVVANGQRLVVFGKPKQRGRQILIDHPEFETVENDAEASIHMQRIVPVHRATEGLSPRLLRKLIWDALRQIDPADFPTLLPSSLYQRDRVEMLRQIHFPDTHESLEEARRHLVLSEFFSMQLTIAQKRQEHGEQPGEAHAGPGEWMRRLHESLPYPLTGAQRRAIEEVRADMASTRPMNRLLHGDVGAGKTMVALSAILLAVEAGYQAALMAPTQILAEQHYLNFRRLLDPLGIRVGLRTGSRKENAGALPLFDQGSADGTRDGEPQILVGTHALLYEGAGFTRLGLAVIDEQHKFGVLQRARLRDQAGGTAPDVLVMTATPIPRTLTMTLYGDLDVSILDELPAGRQKIVTAAREISALPKVIDFLKEKLAAGRQAYVVYPLIDESEKLEAKAAAAEFEKWRELLAPMKCELLHGRIAPEEKDAIMDRFRRNETNVLIATTVIEVGIDVPNASLMLIENAERFGLAQLHQLRGRIGRGEHKSYCVLLTSSEEPAALEKLRILEQTSNGFEIAEADLQIRGPGDILGTAQSGLPPLKLGNLLADAELMRQARGAAFVLMERDPALEQAENQRFRVLLANSRETLAQVS